MGKIYIMTTRSRKPSVTTVVAQAIVHTNPSYSSPAPADITQNNTVETNTALSCVTEPSETLEIIESVPLCENASLDLLLDTPLIYEEDSADETPIVQLESNEHSLTLLDPDTSHLQTLRPIDTTSESMVAFEVSTPSSPNVANSTNTTTCKNDEISEQINRTPDNDENICDSIDDPDYDPSSGKGQMGIDDSETETNSNSIRPPAPEIEELGDQQNRKRRAKASPDEWKRQKNKISRMHGEKYVGFQKVSGKQEQNIERGERKLGPACVSNFCKKTKVFQCDSFSEEDRKYIFDKFWRTYSWNEKKTFVLSLVDVKSKNCKRTTSDNSSRVVTKEYHLKLNDKRVRVCLNMFLNTLGLKEWTVRYWTEFERAHKINIQNELPQDRNIQVESLVSKKESITTFLEMLPKLPSHYCRKSTQKLYLEPVISNKIQLYELYKEDCVLKNKPPGSRKFFNDIFNEKNIGLYIPKKDECDMCCSYKAGNLSDAAYALHIKLKEDARKEKETDKTRAIEGEIYTFTADLQAVKLCPNINASAIYFKTKLAVHNYTIYNLANGKVMCYWFDETAADLKASTFVSFLTDYFGNILRKDPISIVLFTDGCTAQNRNNIVANGLLKLAIDYQIEITQKFLERGHTQMECDSVHSVIERALKNKQIHLPSQYMTITAEARKRPFPYDCRMINYTFVQDFTDKKFHAYDSIRPGRMAGDDVVVDIRALKYNPDGTISYKLRYDAQFRPLPRRPRVIQKGDRKPMYTEPIKIPKTKYQHLQELKSVLPADTHSFYDGLGRN